MQVALFPIYIHLICLCLFVCWLAGRLDFFDTVFWPRLIRDEIINLTDFHVIIVIGDANNIFALVCSDTCMLYLCVRVCVSALYVNQSCVGGLKQFIQSQANALHASTYLNNITWHLL